MKIMSKIKALKDELIEEMKVIVKNANTSSENQAILLKKCNVFSLKLIACY